MTPDSGTNSDPLAELWQRFLPEAEARLRELGEAARLQAADALDEAGRERAIDNAHAIVGAAGMFGRREAADRALDIQRRFEAGSGEGLAGQVEHLRELLAAEGPDG